MRPELYLVLKRHLLCEGGALRLIEPEVLEHVEEEGMTALDSGLSVNHAVVQFHDTAPGLSERESAWTSTGSPQ